MKTPMAVLLTIAVAGLFTACADNSAKSNSDPADEPKASSSSSETPMQPDNSGVNARDAKDNTLTAADQSEIPADREMTQRIRQALMADDSLSLGAHNVKIITVAGLVTLRGPVSSNAERMTIDKKAQEIAGATKVDNQLEVKR